MLSLSIGTGGRVRSTVLILSIGLSSAAQVRAQSTAAAPNAYNDSLQEIVVTAEKRIETVQKTAIAIATISGDEIAAHAENQLDTTLRDVPSLQVQSTPQGGEIYIRGVGANGDSNFIDPSAGESWSTRLPVTLG
jgi:iron complex outermembrane receptor protein